MIKRFVQATNELSLMGKMSLYNFIEACMIKWVGVMKYHTEDSKWIE